MKELHRPCGSVDQSVDVEQQNSQTFQLGRKTMVLYLVMVMSSCNVDLKLQANNT